MDSKFLIFVYEPYEEYHKVISQPFFADNAEMALNHVMQVRKHKRLLFIDVFKVSDSLCIAKTDNQIPVSRLKQMFADFEKEGK